MLGGDVVTEGLGPFGPIFVFFEDALRFFDLGLEAFGFGCSFGASMDSMRADNDAKASRQVFCLAEVGLNMKLLTAFLVAFSNSE